MYFLYIFLFKTVEAKSAAVIQTEIFSSEKRKKNKCSQLFCLEISNPAIRLKKDKTYSNFVIFCQFLTVFFSYSITVNYCSKNTVTVTVMETVLPVIITGNHYLWTL
jgi:hypothetical protein